MGEILACAAAASILAVYEHPPCVGAAVFQSAWCRELSSVPALLLWWTPLRFAGHRHVWPAPAARVSVCSAAVSHLAGYAVRLFVLAVIPARGAAGRIAPAVNLRKNPRILCGLGAGSHDTAAGQLYE